MKIYANTVYELGALRTALSDLTQQGIKFTLDIVGYKGSSAVTTYTGVELVGAQGYLDLCKQDVAWLDKKLADSDQADADMTTAITELKASKEATLEKGLIPKTPPAKEVEDSPGVSAKLEEGELLHLRIMDVTYKAKECLTPPKPKNYRNTVTKYKDDLRREMPNRYLGQLLLAPDKFDSITLVADPAR